MSTSDAESFLLRLERDEHFAVQMQAAGRDPEAIRRLAAEAGFTFTAEEMVEALGNVYGVELTREQLQQIAGGNFRPPPPSPPSVSP